MTTIDTATPVDLAALTQPDDGQVVKTAAPDDQRLWSVTTIIGCLDKPALLYWAAEQTAKAAVATVRSLPARIDDDGPDAVVKWLRDARFRKSKLELTATSLGSIAHRCFELYAITGQRPTPDEIAQLVRQEAGRDFSTEGIAHEAVVVGQMLDQFDRGWLQKFAPVYEATEVTVYHPEFGYAGTLDAIATVGRRVTVDYKSSRKSVDARGDHTGPYPEVALQLAAYRYATHAAVWRPRRFEQFRRRYYLLGPDERAMAVPVPPTDGGICVHVTPEHCTAHPVRCDELVHTHFLYVLECSRWMNEVAGTTIGEPLVEG